MKRMQLPFVAMLVFGVAIPVSAMQSTTELKDAPSRAASTSSLSAVESSQQDPKEAKESKMSVVEQCDAKKSEATAIELTEKQVDELKRLCRLCIGWQYPTHGLDSIHEDQLFKQVSTFVTDLLASEEYQQGIANGTITIEMVLSEHCNDLMKLLHINISEENQAQFKELVVRACHYQKHALLEGQPLLQAVLVVMIILAVLACIYMPDAPASTGGSSSAYAYTDYRANHWNPGTNFLNPNDALQNPFNQFQHILNPLYFPDFNHVGHGRF